MPNQPSQFASWSLVTAALILAAGIIVGAVILRTSRTASAGPPQNTPEEVAEIMGRWQETALNHTALGWMLRESGLSLYTATNRMAIGFTNPDARPSLLDAIREKMPPKPEPLPHSAFRLP